MTKIWEVDFTSFSGTTPLDNIGTQNLTSITNTPTVVSGMAGFNVRPGIRFEINDVEQRYNLHTSSTHNGKFRATYSGTLKRSFNMWCYKTSNTRDTDTTVPHTIWGDLTNNTLNDGFGITTGNSFAYVISGTTQHTTATQSGAGWHMMTMTVDKTINKSIFYFDGEFAASGTFVPSDTEGGSYRCVIGDIFVTREAGMTLGLVSTYDNILSAATVSGLYQTFLIDSLAGEDPAFTLSGTVLGFTENPLANSPLYLINKADHQIYSHATSSGAGQYSINIPFAGDYVLVSTAPFPMDGARAINLTASGVAGSGSITFYDGS